MSTLSVRRPLALLAVLGMVAALLFAVVGTASAADPIDPELPATFSACPDNADIPDPGFSDVPAGTFFYGSVSCLAYYGTTTGTTPDTYDPGADITRAQMALFLARGAGAAGVVLDSTPPDAGFTDIGGLSVEAQTAINALADAGIVKGKTATTYEPASPVLRQQMALFLARYSDAAAEAGPGGHQAGDVTDTDTDFTDIGATTVEAHKAITEVFHLGVATGTTATTYAPLDNVNRGQMASFMTRMYAQMNVRPAGVNIQANPMVIEGAIGPFDVADGVYSVTVRNADFTPAPNVHVDAFSFDAEKATDTPFMTDGTCDPANEQLDTLFPGYDVEADLCKVSINDAVTNTSGNITDEGDAAMPYFDIHWPFTTFYAWTGALNAMFDVDTTAYSSVVIVGVPLPPEADYALFSVDVDTEFDWDEFESGADRFGYVHFGTTVTWTVQLMTIGPNGYPGGGDDTPFAEANVDVVFADHWNDFDSIVPFDSGDILKTVATDASGKATYVVTEELVDKGYTAWHDVSATTAVPVMFVDPDGDVFPAGEIAIEWSAEDPWADSVVLSTPTDYKVINETGTTPNSVTAHVFDQYGDPYTGGGTVTFLSSTSYGLGVPGVTLNLLADGTATANYVWGDGPDPAPSLTEWIDAEVDTDDGDPITYDPHPFGWALEGVAGAMYEGPIRWADTDANLLLIDAGGPMIVETVNGYAHGLFLLSWKADDRFTVGVDGPPVSVSMAEFEEFLEDADYPFGYITYLDPDDDGKTAWFLGLGFPG